jgi:zinc transport system substrate-binding protein
VHGCSSRFRTRGRTSAGSFTLGVIRRLRLAWRAVVGATLAAVACNSSPPPSGRPLVIASFYPLYEFTRQTADGHADVVSLVPPGVEPHDWEPAPQDLKRIREARLFIYNGAGLEPWVAKLSDAAEGPMTSMLRATEGIPLLPAAPSVGSGPDLRGQSDPHVWLDPVLAQSMVETIRAALVRQDPAHAAAYAANARAFSAKLERLHEAFAAGLRECKRREIVTSHAAFAYLAKRYRLTVVPVMGLAPDSEPTPAQLASVVRFARERKVKYIFFETLVSPRLAETLAREIGARTLVFDPIEGMTQEQAAAGTDYITRMEENLNNLRLALDCR